MRDNETIICVTDPYLDGVWQVDSMQHLETNVTGVGTTAVVRVFNEFLLVEQSHLTQIRLTLAPLLLNLIMMMELCAGTIFTNPDLGEFSWGKIDLGPRFTPQVYTYFGDDGVIGLSTCPLITRQNRLAFKEYQDYSG